MKTIGLTGGIGAGKSTVSDYLREKGFQILDGDEMARAMTEKGSPVLKEIAAEFGEDMLFADGSLNRKKLAAAVFGHDEKKSRLETLTTKRVVEDIGKTLAALKGEGREQLVFVDAPLLFETGADRLCDTVWLVTAEIQVRVERVTARDGISADEVLARIHAQMPEEEKRRRADEILDNSEGKERLYRQVDALLEKYVKTKRK